MDPGPIYNYSDGLGIKSPTKRNTKFFRFSNSKPKTFIDEYVDNYRATPGVGKYTPNRNEKIRGTYSYNSPKSAFYDEAAARGMDTPSHYPEINVERYKMRRTQDCKIFKQMKETPNKIVKNNSLSPSQYKVEGQHQSMSTHRRILSYKFSKAQKLTFTDLYISKKKNQPSVGKYDIDKGRDRLTLGAANTRRR